MNKIHNPCGELLRQNPPGSTGYLPAPAPAIVSRRKVWVAIPFGYEIDMLRLHLLTLQPVAHRFLVAETTMTHTTKTEKPLILTESIAKGTIPADIPISVVVVDTHKEKHRICGPKSLLMSSACWSNAKIMENLRTPIRCFDHIA